jgi:hypothetical protein
MIRPFHMGIAPMNGLAAAEGAASSAVFTSASVGTDRLKGPRTVQQQALEVTVHARMEWPANSCNPVR